MYSLILILAIVFLRPVLTNLIFTDLYKKAIALSRNIQRNFYHIILSLSERLVPSFFPLTRYLNLKINKQFVTTVEKNIERKEEIND